MYMIWEAGSSSRWSPATWWVQGQLELDTEDRGCSRNSGGMHGRKWKLHSFVGGDFVLFVVLPFSEEVFLEQNLQTPKVQLDRIWFSHTCFHRETNGKFWALLASFGALLYLTFEELEDQLLTGNSVPRRSGCARSAFHSFFGSYDLTNTNTRQSHLKFR